MTKTFDHLLNHEEKGISYNTPSAKIKSDFKDICPPQYIYRTKVYGGWVVMKYHHGMVFIPDPHHQWEIEK